MTGYSSLCNEEALTIDLILEKCRIWIENCKKVGTLPLIRSQQSRTQVLINNEARAWSAVRSNKGEYCNKTTGRGCKNVFIIQRTDNSITAWYVL